VETKDTREKRARRVMVAFAAIVVFAIAAFTVTMSMTTSYPSTPEPPSVPRPPVPLAEHAAGVPEGAPATTSPRPLTPDVPSATSANAAAPAPVVDAGTRAARGGVLVEDGTSKRSPGDLGTLAREDVKAGVAAVKDKVKDCYERGLKIDEHLGGTLKVSFTLEGNDEGKGVVTKGEIADSDINSPFFEACVLKEIASAEFKAPGGGGVVNVTYPFHFANDPEDAGP
jgi:hypothetical protein